MAVFLSPVGGVAAQFFTNNGVPLSGGKLYTYAAGTTTPAATYTSSSGVTAHANPIVLDSGGRVPGGEIWLTDGTSYKFLLKDSNDVLIATYDNIVGINSNFVNFFAQEEIQTATAGQTVFTLANPYVPGANTLSVFVDGVNQYNGLTYSYVETSASTVTFYSGLHVGALVKFTTVQSLTSGQQTDAALVTYNEGDTGAVTYTVRAKLQQTVSVKDFGAVGDNVTDDTVAIQAAINTGLPVYVPAGRYKVSAKLNMTTGNQSFYGSGNLSIIEAVAGTYSVIGITNTYGVTISNLLINAAGSYTNISNGAGIQIVGSQTCKVQNVTLTNYGFAGVLIQNSYSCDIGNCMFLYAAGYGTATTLASDIAVNYYGGDHIIHDNICNGQGGYGITVQTITQGGTPDYLRYIKIVSNTVSSHNTYGIMLYAMTPQTVVGCLVENNSIRDISGSRPDPTVGQKVYGAGIYLQGDDQTVCANNYIANCNTSTDYDLLAPGAIGSTTGGYKIISNNIIDGTAWFGITVRDPNTAGPTGQQLIIEANILRNCGTHNSESAIQIKELANVSVIGNRIYNQATGTAINQTSATVARSGIIVSNNEISTTQYGIFLQNAVYSVIANNTITNPSLNVVRLLDCNYSTVSGNIVSGAASGFNIAIDATANCYGNIVEQNKITSTQSTGSGIYVQTAYANNTSVSNNDLSGCVNLNQQSGKLLDSGTNTSISANKFGTGVMKGTFTLAAAATTTVANTSAGYWTNVMIMPTNAAAAALMNGSKSLYISAKTNDTSFAVRTADGGSAAGTETFSYMFY